MKNVPMVLGMLTVVALAATAGEPDVNRDGRVDESDARLLARMVAGLDAVDLAHDIDGDGKITLDDVNLVLDAYVPAPSMPEESGGTVPPPAETKNSAGADAAGVLEYFALRRKVSGDCLVVAGEEGIAPGDSIFGVFADFSSAQQSLANHCLNDPVADGQGRESESLLASPILAVAKIDNDESTEGIFFISLETGNAFFIDKVKSSPRSVRTRTLNQNVFEALGRAPTNRAQHGDILAGPICRSNGQMHALLLVDTTTGTMAYISGLDDRSFEGILRPVRGRPGKPLLTKDGDYALTMWQDPSGKTRGAFLINGESGDAIFFDGIGDLDSNPRPRPVTGIPVMNGTFSAVPIQAGDERTSHMVLLDHGTGSLHHALLPKKAPWEVEVSTLTRKIFEAIPHDGPVETPFRFVPVPINATTGETEGAVIIDVATGSMVLLDKVGDPNTLVVVGVNRNLHEKLPQDLPEPRILTAVPKIDSQGATQGAWLFDSVTGGIVYLENLQNPGRLKLLSVAERTR